MRGLVSPFCIALNSGRGRGEEGVKSRLHNRVAFARCLFEADAVENLQRAAVIADKASVFHRLSGKRYRFAIGAQHVCEKFMSVRQGFAFGPIMHHEEPAAQSFLRCMQGIAGDSLLNLGQQRL